MMNWKHSIFLLPALVTTVLGCGGNTSPQPTNDTVVLNRNLVDGAKAGIRTGDVVLRSGKDFTSYRIRELSDKDKTYSHAGIALVQDTSVYIYHITPPDIDEPKSDTAMRLEPLERFANPAKCFGFGVVRYQWNTAEIAAAMEYLDSLYRQKVSFDHLFRLEEPQQQYCSEMVDNALRHATQNRISLARKYFTKIQALKAAKYFHLPMEEVTQRAYISIDNMQLNPSATVIHNYVFLK